MWFYLIIVVYVYRIILSILLMVLLYNRYIGSFILLKFEMEIKLKKYNVYVFNVDI